MARIGPRLVSQNSNALYCEYNPSWSSRRNLSGVIEYSPLLCTNRVKRGRHFEDVIIVLWVRWYLRHSLSYRDLEEMMAERGLAGHVTIWRWVQRYAPILNLRIAGNDGIRIDPGGWRGGRTRLQYPDDEVFTGTYPFGCLRVRPGDTCYRAINPFAVESTSCQQMCNVVTSRLSRRYVRNSANP
jgi:hypothetical protein